MELFLVSLASLLAGFVDAIVGGGGLILVPWEEAADGTVREAIKSYMTDKGCLCETPKVSKQT